MPVCEQNNRTTAADASVDAAAHVGLLEDLLARAVSCSARRETRLTCRDMVHGLLTELEDHNCWTLAKAAGHPGRTGCSTCSHVPAAMSSGYSTLPRVGRPGTWPQASTTAMGC
jgi:hypothetical protein